MLAGINHYRIQTPNTERVLTEGHALPVTLAAVLGDRAVALSTSSGPAVLTANYISGAT